MSFEIEGLTFKYRRRADPALDQVTLSIPGGVTTVVLGMSGSGKTTLLNLLGLLIEKRPRSGHIRYLADQEYEYGRLPLPERNRLRKEHFGFVLQSAYMLRNFSCAYNVRLPLMLRGDSRRERETRHNDLLDQWLGNAEEGKAASERSSFLRRMIRCLFGKKDQPKGGSERSEFAELMPRRPGSVSGGERQRMAVLRAVIHDPHVVFADEPSASLDPVNTRKVHELLLKWRRGDLAGSRQSGQPEKDGRTLILVSHQIGPACEIGDYFVLLRDNQVVCDLVDAGLTPRDKMPGEPDKRALQKWKIDVKEVERLITPRRPNR
jgi:ABC-type lipoprotein export system ATPase subunit